MLKTLCTVSGRVDINTRQVAYCRVLHQPGDNVNVCQTHSNRMPDTGVAEPGGGG